MWLSLIDGHVYLTVLSPINERGFEQYVEKKVKKFENAIFIITEERSCPLYNVGEELKVESFSFTGPSYKPGCLYLTDVIAEIISSKDIFGSITKFSGQKSRFECGGCEGKIYFEFRKEKDYATLQMKMLNEAEEKRRKKHLDKFFGVLRNLDIFEALEDDALSDLTLLLDLTTVPINKVIVKKGDVGSKLFIVLRGRLARLGNDGSTIAEIIPGEIFGETSLLSGEPVSNDIHTIDGTQLAILSSKSFKKVLAKYPVLQLFLFKMLVDRAQTMTLRSGNITSGMTGELAEISTVDLFQLINSSKKTGMVELALDDGRAKFLFKDGEIIYGRYQKLRNKEAVFSVLGVKTGHFSYTKGIPKESEHLKPVAGFMSMMIAGLQQVDEELSN